MRFNELNSRISTRFNEVNHPIADAKDILCAEMFPIEQVFDARLKHLEERLHH